MWNLFNFSVKTVISSYIIGLSSYSYYELIFTLKLIRKPLYHIFYLVFPSTLIGLIGVFSFLLPYHSGDKLNLAVTMLLTSMVFSLLISSSTPETSEKIPLISMQNNNCLLLKFQINLLVNKKGIKRNTIN